MSVNISRRMVLPVSPIPRENDLLIVTVAYNTVESRLSVNLNGVGLDDAITLLTRTSLLMSGQLGDALVAGNTPISLNTNTVLEVS